MQTVLHDKQRSRSADDIIIFSYRGLLKASPYCWQARPTVGVYTMGMNFSVSEVSRR